MLYIYKLYKVHAKLGIQGIHACTQQLLQATALHTFRTPPEPQRPLLHYRAAETWQGGGRGFVPTASFYLCTFPAPLLSPHIPPTLHPHPCCRDVAGSPVDGVRRKIRRRRRTCSDPRTILLLFTLASCLGTIVFVYFKALPGQLP